MVNMAGTTVAECVLSSGTQAVNQTEASFNFTQGEAIPRGTIAALAPLVQGWEWLALAVFTLVYLLNSQLLRSK